MGGLKEETPNIVIFVGLIHLAGGLVLPAGRRVEIKDCIQTLYELCCCFQMKHSGNLPLYWKMLELILLLQLL